MKSKFVGIEADKEILLDIARQIKEQNPRTMKLLGWPYTEKKVPCCLECGKPMKNAIDSITKKVSIYEWETTCGHNKDMRLCIG